MCYILYYIWNKLFHFTHPKLSWPVSIPRHLCEQTIKITFSPPTVTFALMQLWNSKLVSIFNIVSIWYNLVPGLRIWIKVFKNKPNETCPRQPLKTWSDMVCLSRPYHLKLFKRLFSTNFTWSILEHLDPSYMRFYFTMHEKNWIFTNLVNRDTIMFGNSQK